MKLTKENIDQLVDEWHKCNSDLKLHQYLGLTWEQYKLLVMDDTKDIK
ncbi:hypothetical protein [Bacillus siamensis]|nr:hypothetical protein [Bacillus siamensis]MED0836165.1 hypothetical protein [Bacillus siamensis]